MLLYGSTSFLSFYILVNGFFIFIVIVAFFIYSLCQLPLAFGCWRLMHPKLSRDPFDLILSDIPKGGLMDEAIDRRFPQMKTKKCLITKSYDSYLDMFPPEKLVYLSPDSTNIMGKYDPDAIYVIGGIVDVSMTRPLSLAKAKKQRIQHAKLPLGHYVPEFRPGSSQAFALHVIGDILLTLKETNDWKAAFSKIPSRYITNIRKTFANRKSRLPFCSNGTDRYNNRNFK